MGHEDLNPNTPKGGIGHEDLKVHEDLNMV